MIFFKELNTIAEVNDQAPRSPAVGFVFLPSGEAWLFFATHQSVVSIQLAPAGLRQGGGMLLGMEVCTLPFWMFGGTFLQT